MNVKVSLFVIMLFLLAGMSTRADEYAGVRETIEVCTGCHGERGASTDESTPILAGQELHYLYVQLKDYKSGLRQNEIMGSVVEDLEKKQLLKLAEYFSKQTWPRIPFKGDPKRVSNGERAANSGQCVACHLGSYTGNSRIPRLAGQYPKYLAKTMLEMKTKVRNNAPAVSSLISSFSDEEISDMAEYMGDM